MDFRKAWGTKSLNLLRDLGPTPTTARTQHLDSILVYMSPSPVVVDDTDWAKLSYHGTWYGVRTGNPGVYNGTVFQTRSPGSAHISFVGSFVEVVGTVLGRVSGSTYPIISTYIIDDNEVGSFTAAPGDVEKDGVAFFSSGNLELSSHTLVINVTNASSDYPFILDYVVYVPPPTPDSIISPSTTPSSSALASSSLPTTFLSSSSSSSSSDPTTTLSAQLPESPKLTTNIPASYPTNSTTTLLVLSSTDSTVKVPSTSASTTTESASSTPKASTTTAIVFNVANGSSSNHTGAIIGGVVGGVALLAALFVLLWWKRRGERRRSGVNENRSNSVGPVPQHPAIPRVTPFLLPRDYNSLSACFVSPETAAPLGPRSALGVPGAYTTPHNSKTALIATVNNHGGSGDTLVPASGSRRGPPSEASTANASRSTTQLRVESEQDVRTHAPLHYGAFPDDTLSLALTEVPPSYTSG